MPDSTTGNVTFAFSGARVTSSSGPLPDARLAVRMTVSFYQSDSPTAYVYVDDILLPTSGEFSHGRDIPRAEEAAFEHNGIGVGWAEIQIEALVEGAPEPSALLREAVIALPSGDASFFEAAGQAFDGAVFELDLGAIESVALTFVLSSDDLTTEDFDGVLSLDCDVMHNPAGLIPMPPGIPDVRPDAVLYHTVPAFRSGDEFQTTLFLDPTPLGTGEFFLRLRRATDTGDEVVMRSPPFEAVEALRENRYGLIARIEEVQAVGTVGASLPDPIWENPIRIENPDLDFVADTISRPGGLEFSGDIHVATGENSFLALRVGSANLAFGVSYRVRDRQPFTDGEFASLFSVTATQCDIDLIGGVLDDLPWWAAALLGALLGGGAITTAVLMSLIESAVTPVATEAALDRVADEIGGASVQNRIDSEVDAQIEDALEEWGDLAESVDVDAVKEAVWFEGDAVAFTVNEVTMTGWVGFWNHAAFYLTDEFRNALDTLEDLTDQFLDFDSCGFDESAESETESQAFRSFEKALSLEGVRDWRREYETHRAEVAALARRHPSLARRAAAFALRHRRAVEGPEGIVPTEAVRDFARLAEHVTVRASPRLGGFLRRVRSALVEVEGKPFEEAARHAGTLLRPKRLPREEALRREVPLGWLAPGGRLTSVERAERPRRRGR